jgi:pectin methylesterase-like acyl-CoA thioesterase
MIPTTRKIVNIKISTSFFFFFFFWALSSQIEFITHVDTALIHFEMRIQFSKCLALSLTLLSTSLAEGQQVTTAICQFPTARALDGCPPNTILVGQNGTSAQFHSLQDAIDYLPDDDSTQTILLLPGDYKEQINITRKGPITLLGQTRNPWNQSANLVTLNWNSANFAGSGFNDNAYTSVLTVAPNLNASLTGSGNSANPLLLIFVQPSPPSIFFCLKK